MTQYPRIRALPARNRSTSRNRMHATTETR